MLKATIKTTHKHIFKPDSEQSFLLIILYKYNKYILKELFNITNNDNIINDNIIN